MLKYISLFIYYTVGNKIPNKFKGKLFRNILVKNIFKYTGKNITISEKVYFGKGQKIEIYDNAGIGPNSSIYGSGNVKIKENVIMGPEIMILTGSHNVYFENGKRTNERVTGDIIIGKNCFIGARTTILANVNIGDNVVIGANSLVNKDLEQGYLYAGSPVKKIKKIEK